MAVPDSLLVGKVVVVNGGVQLPADLVGTALYLLSELSTLVTGQMIVVNGGEAFY